jgi:hypothetical protein
MKFTFLHPAVDIPGYYVVAIIPQFVIEFALPNDLSAGLF